MASAWVALILGLRGFAERLQGWIYLTSVYYQNLLGLSPLLNALRILPGPVTGILCSVLPSIVHVVALIQSRNSIS